MGLTDVDGVKRIVESGIGGGRVYEEKCILGNLGKFSQKEVDGQQSSGSAEVLNLIDDGKRADLTITLGLARTPIFNATAAFVTSFYAKECIVSFPVFSYKRY
jgi:hypothetical protein